jgi:hypothetical protein
VAEAVLFYSIDMSETWILISRLPGNPGFYLWEVPYVWSSTCKVKVRLVDADGKIEVRDVSSGTFTIQPYQ